MADTQTSPVVITGGGRRIGLALAQHFLAQQQPVIVSYRSGYPAIAALEQAGAVCIAADFSSDSGILAFADAVKQRTTSLRAVLHNASAWLAESNITPPGEILSAML